jgi:hypothetical protein
MRQLHHGGALLIIPRATFTHLNVKYKIDYRRMEEALAERCASEIMALGYRHFGLATEDKEQVRLVLPELEEAERRNADAASAEAGALQFIASLSGVDGLVLAVCGMSIRGFGVEILADRIQRLHFWLRMRRARRVSQLIQPAGAQDIAQ